MIFNNKLDRCFDADFNELLILFFRGTLEHKRRLLGQLAI